MLGRVITLEVWITPSIRNERKPYDAKEKETKGPRAFRLQNFLGVFPFDDRLTQR